MRLSDRQQHFVVYVGMLLIRANRLGIKLTFGDAWRSSQRLKCPTCKSRHSFHELLFFNGRSKIKVGGKHAQRLAIDLIIWRNGKPCWNREAYRILGEYWEFIGGGVWGGRFNIAKKDYGTKVGWDPGHFQGF